MFLPRDRRKKQGTAGVSVGGNWWGMTTKLREFRFRGWLKRLDESERLANELGK